MGTMRVRVRGMGGMSWKLSRVVCVCVAVNGGFYNCSRGNVEFDLYCTTDCFYVCVCVCLFVPSVPSIMSLRFSFLFFCFLYISAYKCQEYRVGAHYMYYFFPNSPYRGLSKSLQYIYQVCNCRVRLP